MRNILSKRNLIRGLTAALAFLFCVVASLTALMFENAGIISARLGISGSTLVGTGEIYYKTDYTDDGAPSDVGLEKLIFDADAYERQTVAEGCVLLENNGALPLDLQRDSKVTVFGRNVIDPVYSGAVLIGQDETRTKTLVDCLKDEGFSVNETLLNAYRNSNVNRVITGQNRNIGEVGIDFYTSALRDSFDSYKDVAIVNLTRESCEGADILQHDAEGISGLALHQAEKDMLQMVGAAGFGKVIVVINSANAMEVGELMDPAYNVDAVLVMGVPGITGFYGVVDVLTGKTNPSGALSDTWAADSLSAPAVRNFGEFWYSNTEQSDYAGPSSAGETYLIYAEGIYVGYKYYETRYEDCILGQGNAKGNYGIYDSRSNEWSYADEMDYPFGYGLSYTTFSQELKDVAVDDDAGTITVRVAVENTGDVAGKDIVQLYAQTPYTEYDRENLIEKSAIQLLDFVKTDILQPGESKEYEIVADQYLLASYDHNKAEGYIMDAGDYYVAIGDDCHDALNNILAAKGAAGMVDAEGNPVSGNADQAYHWTRNALDTETYRYSETGALVTNRFDDDIYAVDFNHFVPDAVTYLTRQDWSTYPKSYTDLAITEQMRKVHNNEFYDDVVPENAPSVDSFTQEKDAGIKFVDMKGVPFDDDEKWNTFLDQLSYRDLGIAVSDSFSLPTIATVQKPSQLNQDSPDGCRSQYKYGSKNYATAYASSTVLAATWNKELASQRGYFMGEDCLYCGQHILWGSGCNLHRTPFGGRNFEYYSEDGIMTYHMSARVVAGLVDKGIVTGVKHLLANDQESPRSCVTTFMTEQTLREGTMRAFEGAFVKGGANGTMSSYNALGVCQTAANAALLKGVLREEWGFKGVAITDMGSCSNAYPLCNIQGSTMFCGGPNAGEYIIQQINRGDGYALECLREANKYFYYAFANSSLVNGLGDDVAIVDSVEWWKIAVIAIDCVVGVLMAGGVVLFVLGEYTAKKKKERA